MRCPKCHCDNIQMMVDVTILAPSEMEGQITKKNINSKKVKLYAANWPRASYFCQTENCGWCMLPDRTDSNLTESEEDI
jgi:hypothetical protein